MEDYGIKQMWSDKVTASNATQQHALGVLRFEGGKVYRYIKAGPTLTGDTLSVRNVVSYIINATAGTNAFVVTNTSADVNATAGVVIAAIPENYYGWIQISGPASVVGDGSVAFGEIVVNNGDGTVDTWAADEDGIGFALEDDVATTFYVEIMLKGLL